MQAFEWANWAGGIIVSALPPALLGTFAVVAFALFLYRYRAGYEIPNAALLPYCITMLTYAGFYVFIEIVNSTYNPSIIFSNMVRGVSRLAIGLAVIVALIENLAAVYVIARPALRAKRNGAARDE